MELLRSDGIELPTAAGFPLRQCRSWEEIAAGASVAGYSNLPLLFYGESPTSKWSLHPPSILTRRILRPTMTLCRRRFPNRLEMWNRCHKNKKGDVCVLASSAHPAAQVPLATSFHGHWNLNVYFFFFSRVGGWGGWFPVSIPRIWLIFWCFMGESETAMGDGVSVIRGLWGRLVRSDGRD